MVHVCDTQYPQCRNVDFLMLHAGGGWGGGGCILFMALSHSGESSRGLPPDV